MTTTIILGGTKDQVIKQLTCEHDWHGPCIDDISRYNKCKKCFCLERDMTPNQYHSALKPGYENVADTDTVIGNAATSKETLIHFRCDHCDKWWSMSEARLPTVVYCPSCGQKQFAGME